MKPEITKEIESLKEAFILAECELSRMDQTLPAFMEEVRAFSAENAKELTAKMERIAYSIEPKLRSDLLEKVSALHAMTARSSSDALAAIRAALPSLLESWQEKIAVRILEISRDATTEQFAACLTALGDEVKGDVGKAITVLSENLTAIKSDVEARMMTREQVQSFAAEAVGTMFEEFAAGQKKSVTDLRQAFDRSFVKFAAENQSQPANLASAFRGPWDEVALYKRGDLFLYRGGTWLVLKESLGITPHRKECTGNDRRYTLFAAPGAPGSAGRDGAAAGAGGTGLATKVSFPANTAASGTDGEYSISATEFAVYVTGTGWLFAQLYSR